ncbi:unnamed protein product [Pleuronectes platessa]|uniref:Uncharacterized protein n=1 Tax=Pleuronectes platessa TaxID=8262 RepID=A0A9N7U7K4_PLEPL|nr:unnamed protein product [Pleuronectes platessa]
MSPSRNENHASKQLSDRQGELSLPCPPALLSVHNEPRSETWSRVMTGRSPGDNALQHVREYLSKLLETIVSCARQKVDDGFQRFEGPFIRQLIRGPVRADCLEWDAGPVR